MKNKNWSREELEAAVISYIEMRQKSLDGESFIKKEYYKELSDHYGRTIKSYEYRMQNISYVYSLMGREWLKGLPPAKNVGTRVISEIEEIINKIEDQTLLKIAEFQSTVNNFRKKSFNKVPSGNTKPVKNTNQVTQYVRSPEVVAWVLNESNGVCECCGKEAPFVKEDDTPFLEVHHLKRLADGGSDTISNAIAVCPNCHRELHYGKNRVLLMEGMYSKIDRIKTR